MYIFMHIYHVEYLCMYIKTPMDLESSHPAMDSRVVAEQHWGSQIQPPSKGVHWNHHCEKVMCGLYDLVNHIKPYISSQLLNIQKRYDLVNNMVNFTKWLNSPFIAIMSSQVSLVFETSSSITDGPEGWPLAKDISGLQMFTTRTE